MDDYADFTEYADYTDYTDYTVGYKRLHPIATVGVKVRVRVGVRVRFRFRLKSRLGSGLGKQVRGTKSPYVLCLVISKAVKSLIKPYTV